MGPIAKEARVGELAGSYFILGCRSWLLDPEACGIGGSGVTVPAGVGKFADGGSAQSEDRFEVWTT